MTGRGWAISALALCTAQVVLYLCDGLGCGLKVYGAHSGGLGAADVF